MKNFSVALISAMLFAHSVASEAEQWTRSRSNGSDKVSNTFKKSADDHYGSDEDYLRNQNAHVPHHGDNSHDDDWSKFGSSRNNSVKKIYRKPAGSNKRNVGFTPAKSYSEFTSGKSTSNSHDNKEEQRCKVKNLYGEGDKENDSYGHDDYDSHGHDSYGNDSYRPEPESYEEFTARTSEGNDSHGRASYGKKDDHDSYNFDFGFGDKSPGYGKSSYGRDNHDSHGHDSFGKNSYGNDSHGHDSFGKNSYGNDSHGNDSYGKNSYGNDSHGNDSYGKNSYGNDSHGNDSYGKNSYGNDSHGNDSYGKNSYGNDSHGRASYGKKDDHDSNGFDNNFDFGFGDKSPGYHQSRGNAKNPRSAKRESYRSNVGKKTVAGQTDHTPKPHQSYHDWRDYDQNRYGGSNPYAECKWPKQTKNLDTPEYQNLSANCKLEVIWQNILEDETRELFFVGPGFQSLFDQDMNHSYDSVTDTMPEGRVKVTHPVGTVTKVEFIAHPETPYTGVFKGAKHGIMRISETVKTTPEKSKTIPGHGVKFLRDGMYSANWLAMFSFDGHKSFNFFKNRWTTILREPNNICARQTIGKHLATVTDHIGGTSVMEIAQFDQYGNEEKTPNWPFQVDVEPYDVYGWTDEYQNDFQDQLSVIPMDTSMFKVFAYDEPPELGGKDRLIGWLVSRSDTISSHWGDQQLFFQHRRMDDDIKVRPHYFEWLQFWDEGKFTETALINPAPMQKCPFFFLFEKAGIV